MAETSTPNEVAANHSKISCYFYDGVLENLKYFAKKEESSAQAIIRRAVNKEIELLIQDVEQEYELTKKKLAHLQKKIAERKATERIEAA